MEGIKDTLADIAPLLTKDRQGTQMTTVTVVETIAANANDVFQILGDFSRIKVGGAITALSDPEREYDECLLKAEAMMETLNGHA